MSEKYHNRWHRTLRIGATSFNCFSDNSKMHVLFISAVHFGCPVALFDRLASVSEAFEEEFQDESISLHQLVEVANKVFKRILSFSVSSEFKNCD